MESLSFINREEIIGIVFTVIAYYMLSQIIKRNEDDGDSFSTFLLWAVLDGLCSVTDFIRDGNTWILSTVFAFGSGVIAIQLFRQGKIKWDTDDTVVTALVVVSMLIWAILGPDKGSIVATVAVLIAGLTQVKESKKVICTKKNIQYFITWTFFLIGSIFFFFGKITTDCNDFIKERLYPAIDGIVSVFMVGVYLVNIFKKNKYGKQLDLFE